MLACNSGSLRANARSGRDSVCAGARKAARDGMADKPAGQRIFTNSEAFAGC